MSSQKHSFIIDGEHQSMHGNSRIYIYIYMLSKIASIKVLEGYCTL